jgi:hypothetical protein
MHISILLYGSFPQYFTQVLRKFGNITQWSGSEAWQDYSWVGVSSHRFSPEAFRELATSALHSGKTFGVIDTDPFYIQCLSEITGIHPEVACTGVLVSPWKDAQGHSHYKVLFFHDVSGEKSAGLASRGKSLDALKYLFASNAMRMHMNALRDYQESALRLPAAANYAIVPIQKRPVVYHTNNIRDLTRVEFAHHATISAHYAGDERCEITVHHHLGDFTSGLYRHLNETSIHFDSDGFDLLDWKQWYKYRLTCSLHTEENDTQLFSINALPSPTGDEALRQTRVHSNVAAKATRTSLALAADVDTKALAKNTELPVDHFSSLSSFTLSLPAGTPIPRFRLFLDFGLRIRQEQEHTSAGYHHAETTSREAEYKGHQRLATEWIDLNALLTKN